MTLAVSAKGQITIPKAVRDKTGITPGKRVKVFARHDGTIWMLPVTPVTALRRLLKSRRRRPISLKDMDDAIAASVRSPRR